MAKKIEKSLLLQLNAKNADIDAFKALIADYSAMYDVCIALKKDIKERGTIVTETNCTGREVRKANPSIKELRDTNKAMLAILKQLNLDTDTVRVKSEDDEL